ncbi:hypothetical protein ABPG73_018190 [Tetrahymena malaccensis]
MKRFIIILICIIIRCAHSFNFIKIPQVFIGDVTYFVNIGELQLPGQRQATHSINHSVQFTSTPQILLAIQEFDLVKGDYNFQATVSSSSSTQFSLTLQKDGASGLANIKFQYLAINLKDSFVKTGHLNFQENIVSCVPNWMCSKQTFNYQKSNYNSQKQNVTVGFYFVGIEKVQLQNTVQTISFINEIVYSSSSFDIIIKTRDFNIYNKINKIYYNYIEIYQQIDKNYYHFFNKRDDSINPIPPNNPLTQPSTQPRYSQFPTYNINIDVISGIFLGFTGMEVNYFNLRFAFGQPQFNLVDQNQYSYQVSYKTYGDTLIIGGQAQIMVFAQVNCNINNQYFLDDQQQCVSSCPDGYYLAHTPDPTYGITLNQCLSCDASCKTCYGPTPQNCLSCSNAYLLNSICYNIRPNNTYCDENNSCKLCTKTQSDQTTPMCNICDITLMNCLQCFNPSQYLYKKICQVDRPIRTYCDSKNICEDCYINCESCRQTTSKDCLSCKQPFVLYQNQCICPDLSQTYNIQTNQCEYKEPSVISQDAQKKFQNGGSAVNQASFGMSIGFTLAQGFTSSGCALFSQILTIQKIFYLELINISTPRFLLQFIKAISNEGITKKFQALNAFKYYMDFESQDHNSTLDYQFKYNNISSSLAKNSGGGFFTLIIIIIFQFLSQILTSSQCQSDFFKIYDQFISSLFIQLLQSLILLFFYSSLLYMLDDKQVKGVPGYVFLIIYFVYIILALIIQSIALFKLKINEKRFNQYEPQIQDILQIQLANGSILQKAQSRMYMIIFQIFENILFPLVVVSFKSSYIGQMSSLITIQTLEFIITLYIRPFQNKLVNISFIFEQGTWIVIYVLFCVQSCLIDQLDPTIQVYPQNITILLIVILFLICFAVLINPIFQLIQIFILLKQCYQQKKTRNKNSTQKDLNDTKQINKKMLMDINFQELTDYQYKR